ncbi:MAG: hypothetical protein V3U79_03360 [Dehalococcoidia bacterium]
MKRKLLYVVTGIAVLLIGTYGVLAILAKPVPDHPFFQQDDVLVIAHQGGLGLWTGNSLYAFESAMELGG